MSDAQDFLIKKDTLYKYEGHDEEVVIPSYVRRIAPDAFRDCRDIKKVITPVRLVRIGNRAFYGCDNLAEVLIPGALFKRVKVKKIFSDSDKIYFRFYVSSGAEEDDDETYGAEWEDVDEEPAPAPEASPEVAGGEDEQPSAEECVPEAPQEPPEDDRIVGATTLLVDVSLTEDGGEAQEEAVVREEVEVGILPEETAVESDGRTLRERIEAVTPEEVPPEKISAARRKELLNLTDFLIEDTTLVKYIGTSRKVEIPEFITRIGENAFANSNITDVYIPAGVKYICARAFTWCECLSSVAFPEGLELIDDLAFANCTSLEEVHFPASVRCIGESAFHACSSLRKVILGDGIRSVSRRAFDFCTSLTDVALPESVEALNDGAFSHCESLKSVRLPAKLKSIANWAFAECYALADVDLPDGLEEIGDVAFMNCRTLKKVAMPQSVKRLGRQCYVNCTGLILILVPERLREQVRALKVFQGVGSAEVEYV